MKGEVQASLTDVTHATHVAPEHFPVLDRLGGIAILSVLARWSDAPGR
jgi:hypothetical protein